ncbi:MAG: arginine repressor [Lachnospiraceae bacterium]|nr:arginine repressor [Lachnospiraceae bacterium]
MKRDRQTAILRMIKDEEIGTQEELAERLRAAGYSVTQATVSRDIRELFLTKVTIGGGRQKYTVMREHGPNMEEKYTRVLREGLEEIVAAQNIVVLKTGVGMAMAVAAAVDAFPIDQIVGSVAGDDTILVVTHSAEEAQIVKKKLEEILS